VENLSVDFEGYRVKKNNRCVAVLILLLGIAVDVHAAPESSPGQVPLAKGEQPPPTYKAPYPFTVDELWGKILKVAELPEGYVTKEQVSGIFGVTMNLDQEYLKQYHEKIYPLMREKSWYFNMSVGENIPSRSFFYFSWGEIPGQRSAEFPPPPPPGMCINVYKIRPDLPRRGWLLRREDKGDNDLYSDTYRKDRIGVLTIEFFQSDNCLRSIRIAASASAARELPPE
jgi:hypothetical protein